MTTIQLLRELSLKLIVLDRIRSPSAEHWATLHDIGAKLGVEVPPQTGFYSQRKLLWEAIRQQAREQVCKHITIGDTVRFQHKERTVHSITPTFRVVLEYEGKKVTASPLTIAPRMSHDYSYMTGAQ
jgi:hypothetical protein